MKFREDLKNLDFRKDLALGKSSSFKVTAAMMISKPSGPTSKVNWWHEEIKILWVVPCERMNVW